MNNLSEYLASVFPQKEHLFVCFTGGGGKSSSLKTLGSYFKKKGRSVLLTTTTKFQNPSSFDWGADYVFTDTDKMLSFFPDESYKGGYTVLFGEYYSSEKLKSPSLATLSVLKDRFDVILCEADGSRGLPFKVHSEKDPVVPSFCDFVVSVLGADGALKDVSDVTFGSENMENPPAADSRADAQFLSLLVSDAEGILKASREGRRAILINRGDNCTEEQANIFLNVKWPSDCAIIYASVQKNCIYTLIQEVKK